MNDEKLHYVAMVIAEFTDKVPDADMIAAWVHSEDDTLQHWISDNLKMRFFWSTSIGILEAAFKIVDDAYSNGNLK